MRYIFKIVLPQAPNVALATRNTLRVMQDAGSIIITSEDPMVFESTTMTEAQAMAVETRLLSWGCDVDLEVDDGTGN